MSQLERENVQDTSNATMINYGGDRNGIPRIIFHTALGTMNCFRLLIKHFLHQNIGPVIGISIADVQKYCGAEIEGLIRSLATDYTNRIADTEYKEFQLVGYSFGGLIAVEVGKELSEKGLRVSDLVLIDSMPPFFNIEDDLFLETIFVPNLNISFENAVAAAGMGNIDREDYVRGVMKVFNETQMRFPKDALLRIEGDEKLEKLSNVFKRLNALTRRERFQIYLRDRHPYNEILLSVETAEVLFDTYAKSIKAARFPLTPYNGDIRYLKTIETDKYVSSLWDNVLNFWKNICMGNIKISEIEGNHFTCITVEPFVSKLAQEISKPFLEPLYI